MASFNRVFLMGNLTRDPEIKYLPSGKPVADIGLAVNSNWTNDKGEKMESTTFVDVTLFGRIAEIVGEYCKKGRPLFVEGKLSLDQWEDKQTGQKRSKLKVIGDNIQLLGGAPGGDNKPRESTQEPEHTSAPASRSGPPRDPDLNAPEDDIPF